MGTKLLWIGLTLIMAVPVIIPALSVVSVGGALLMIVGSVLVLLDK